MTGPSDPRETASPPIDVASRDAERRARSRRARDGTSDVEIRIFEATEALLATTSLVHLRVEDIITRAGVSRRTFYLYFPSKEAILIRLSARFMEMGAASFAAFGDGHPGVSGRVALQRAVEANCELWTEHRAVLRAMTENWYLLPEIRDTWLTTIDRYAKDLSEEIDRERALGAAPAGIDSRRLASLLLWSTGHCLYIAGLGIDEHLPDETTISGDLLALWLGTIYGTTSPPVDAP